MLRFKSRELWLINRNKNTCFFNNSLKERYRRNGITSLEGSNGKLEGVGEIKKAVKKHFKTFFLENNTSRPLPEGLDLNSLNDHDSKWLERPFRRRRLRMRCGLVVKTKARV